MKIRGALRNELLSLRERHEDADLNAYVFPTSTGGRQSQDNFRHRILGRAASINVKRPRQGHGRGGERAVRRGGALPAS